MLTFIIIGVIVVIIACVMIVAFARKASNSTTVNPAQTSKPGLSPEQSASINKARSQLTNARMTISRIKDAQISQAGNNACDSIEKVLQTLKEKPEKIQTTRQLFNYYLPTLDKVVSKYQRIESSGTVEEEMPGKVKAYLDNVTEAMGNLYEGLFDNDKLNVSVDMEAMTIAIKRDGLLDDDDFKDLSSQNTAEAGDTEKTEEEGQVLELNL